jgi:hypothetical protein
MAGLTQIFDQQQEGKSKRLSKAQKQTGGHRLLACVPCENPESSAVTKQNGG